MLVEVGGIGHRVLVTPVTAAALGDLGEDVFLHTHHHIREDCELLYGFATRDDRVCFEAVLGAHGVGPALALAICAVHRPDALRRAVVQDDVDALCLVPGVGKKTAARLLIELKTRLAVEGMGTEMGDLGPAAAVVGSNGRSAHVDVREALVALGYSPDEIRGALAELPADLLRDADTATLVKHALKGLGARHA